MKIFKDSFDRRRGSLRCLLETLTGIGQLQLGHRFRIPGTILKSG
jgi:hypothetical protein